MKRIHLCAWSVLLALFFSPGPGLAGDKTHPIAAQVKAHVKDANKPFTMLVTLRVKEGSEDKFATAFAKAIKPTRKEKGCLEYQLNQDAKMPTQFLVYERWENLASLEAHLESKHILTLLEEVGEMLAGPPEVRVLLPAGE